MLLAPAVLLVGVAVIGLIPGVVPGIERAAHHFTDHAAYARWVLQGAAPHFAPAITSHIETFDYLYGAGAVIGAVGLAPLSLFGPSLRERAPASLIESLRGGLPGRP